VAPERVTIIKPREWSRSNLETPMISTADLGIREEIESSS
jgi:hypothetical protein